MVKKNKKRKIEKNEKAIKMMKTMDGREDVNMNNETSMIIEPSNDNENNVNPIESING